MLEKFRQMFFTTKGRLNRMNYFLYSLGLGIIAFLITFVVSFIIIISSGSTESFTYKAFETAIYFVWFISYLTLAVRRLHDLDKKEWLVVLNLIPVINFFFAIYLLFFPGTPGRNQYGEQP